MALIKCKECGKDVSDKASSCPNCGFPINFNFKEKPLENKESTTEKTSKSNILAGLMLILFYPLGALGISISFFGIIWAIVEIADKKIKVKGWAIASLLIFIITFFIGFLTV